MLTSLTLHPSAPDPNEESTTPARLPIEGYLGASNKSDHYRLYLDATFQRYYEIPMASLEEIEPVDPNNQGPTKFYLWAGTRIEAVTILYFDIVDPVGGNGSHNH